MRLAAVALALLSVALLGGCQEGEKSRESNARQQYALGVPVWQASCTEWTKAPLHKRRATLTEMKAVRRQQLSGEGVGRGYGSVLDDDVAYRLFDERCKAPGSEAFLLYRMYGFAAGFVGEKGR